MPINVSDVPVYAGSVFEKVQSIMLGAVLPENRFKIKADKPVSPRKFEKVVGILLDRIYRDPDTGLPNYESFRESLEKLIDKRQKKHDENEGKNIRDRTPIPKDTVLFFDMNYMKNFNQEIGMQKTDKLIASVAEILHDSFRIKKEPISDHNDPRNAKNKADKKFNADIVARAKKGGDEFIVLMRGCSKEHAKAKADKIFAEIKKKVFMVADANPRGHKNAMISNVSLSYGYYELDSKLNANIEEYQDTAETALAKAEELMKQRKENWKKDGRVTPPSIQKLPLNTLYMLSAPVPREDVIEIPAVFEAIRR